MMSKVAFQRLGPRYKNIRITITAITIKARVQHLTFYIVPGEKSQIVGRLPVHQFFTLKSQSY